MTLSQIFISISDFSYQNHSTDVPQTSALSKQLLTRTNSCSP